LPTNVIYYTSVYQDQNEVVSTIQKHFTFYTQEQWYENENNKLKLLGGIQLIQYVKSLPPLSAPMDEDVRNITTMRGSYNT